MAHDVGDVGQLVILFIVVKPHAARRGIGVNTVAPRAIAANFSGGMMRDNSAVNKQIAGLTALGRVGHTHDIGPMIASLLCEENRWVIAQRIKVLAVR